MNYLIKALSSLVWLTLLASCANTTITARNPYRGEKLARPAHIFIEDFAAGTTATGDQLGRLVADHLVSNISAMGLPALPARQGGKRQVGDLVIRGRFISADAGSASERALVGFGSGAADLEVAIEGYEVTARGLKRLGSGQAQAEGDKKPGMLAGLAGLAATGNPVGLIVGGLSKIAGEQTGSASLEGMAKQAADKIADELKPKFKEQGWL
ncbi:MAG TPA: DUF4410 domain-containing protein [Zoogloea sp.]|nr:DUF4410 domain-containing protein [Zoogloea sp.]